LCCFIMDLKTIMDWTPCGHDYQQAVSPPPIQKGYGAGVSKQTNDSQKSPLLPGQTPFYAAKQVSTLQNSPRPPAPAKSLKSCISVGAPGVVPPCIMPLPKSTLSGSSLGDDRESNIRMIPISTEQGQFFIPVDVKAASKAADEKRARNAGASARFRERRKQKEKEASMNIRKLEQQLRDLETKLRVVEAEREFYRSERDRFRDVVERTPSMREFARQAPQNPRPVQTPVFLLPPLYW
jgi:hypothetical protein